MPSMAPATRSTLQFLSLAVRSKAILRLLIISAIFVALFFSYANEQRVAERRRLNAVPPPGSVEKAVVTAKRWREDPSWLHDPELGWTPYIYTASRPPERGYSLRVPSYQGREATAYLAFIVDNYDHLPQYTAFVHADPEQWHNDILGPRTGNILKNLRMDSVDRFGYVNLRCTHDDGCPIAVNPHEPTELDVRNKDIRAYFAEVYMELFDVPREKVPAHLGTVCCAQFVVSRNRIRARPKRDYERMLRWATTSHLTDSFGIGWVFEKIWHVIFGMDAVHCPSFEQCRCDLFGWCGPKGDPSLGTAAKLLSG